MYKQQSNIATKLKKQSVKHNFSKYNLEEYIIFCFPFIVTRGQISSEIQQKILLLYWTRHKNIYTKTFQIMAKFKL